MNRRAGNYISFLLRDKIRSSLKVKNLGQAALNLLEREIRYFKNLNYEFMTIKDFCFQKGWIEET